MNTHLSMGFPVHSMLLLHEMLDEVLEVFHFRPPQRRSHLPYKKKKEARHYGRPSVPDRYILQEYVHEEKKLPDLERTRLRSYSSGWIRIASLLRESQVGGNTLDAFLAESSMIPIEWKGYKGVCFGSTIFTDSYYDAAGSLHYFLRCVRWNGSEWVSEMHHIDEHNPGDKEYPEVVILNTFGVFMEKLIGYVSFQH